MSMSLILVSQVYTMRTNLFTLVQLQEFASQSILIFELYECELDCKISSEEFGYVNYSKFKVNVFADT